LQWQSFIAREDIYKDGVSSANYKGYFRDEVTPLAIRFIKDGDYTPNYPLIGRPATALDLEVIDNRDSNSVNKQNFDEEGNVLDLENQINKRWQLYNTATKNSGENPFLSNITSNTFEEGVTKVTVVEDLDSVSNGSFTLSLEEGENFTGIKDYFNQNIEELLNTDSSNLSDGLNDVIYIFDPSNYENRDLLPDYSVNCGEVLLQSEIISVQNEIDEDLNLNLDYFLRNILDREYKLQHPVSHLN